MAAYFAGCDSQRKDVHVLGSQFLSSAGPVICT